MTLILKSRLDFHLLVIVIDLLSLPLHQSQDQKSYQRYFYQLNFPSINSRTHSLFTDNKFLRIRQPLKTSLILSELRHICLSNLSDSNTCKQCSFSSSKFSLKSTFYAFSPSLTNLSFNCKLEYIINKALRSLILS